MSYKMNIDHLLNAGDTRAPAVAQLEGASQNFFSVEFHEFE